MKIIDKITGKLYNKVFGIRCDIRPGIHYFNEKHYNGLIKEEFSFNNDKGITLRGGIYHYETFDENTLVVFNHGIGGGHEAYMQEINYLAKNGFKVLAMDYVGCVHSDGESMIGVSEPIKDMSLCLDLVKKDYKNIYVIGHSWGGYVSQGLTMTHKEIKKIVLLAGLNSLKSMLDQNLKFPLNIFIKPCCKLEKQLFGDYATYSASNSLNREDLSGLVIQSNDDKILKTKYNIDLIKQNNTNKNIEFIYVDNKNHNPEYTVDAVKNLTNYLSKLNRLKTDNEKEDLANITNWDELCDLDNFVMDKIIDFLKK